MKFLKVLFILLFVLIILGIIGIFIFVKTIDVNSYKPEIIEKISEFLDREVDFDDIDFNLSFKKGLKLDFVNLKIRDDANFQENDFLNISSLSLDVDILAFLTKKEIITSDMKIVSPKIKIIRNSEGQLNLQDIGSKKTKVENKKNSLSSKGVFALPLIMINSINLKNGTVVYVDKTFEPELVLEISHLDIKINQFSIKEDFSFIAKAAIFSDKQNVNIEGKLQVKIVDKRILFSDVKIVNDLSKLSLYEFKKLLPMVEGGTLPEYLKGELETNIKELVLSEDGVSSLLMDSELNEGSLSFKEIVPGVSLNISNIRFKVKDFSLNDTFNVKVEAAYLSEHPNVFFETKASIDKDQQLLMLKYAKFTTLLSSFSLSKLESSLKMGKEFEFPDKLNGKVKFSIHEAKFDKNGLFSLNSTCEINEGFVKFNQFILPIYDLSSRFQLTETNIDIEKLVLTIGRGKVNGFFVLTDYLGEQDWSVELNIKDLNPGEIIDQKEQLIKIDGLVSGNFNGKAKGLTVDKLANSLIGKGELNVKKGKISDINILQIVLDKISVLPGFAEKFKSNLPQSYVNKLDEKDTIIRRLTLQADIKNGVVEINPVEVKADGFIFVGLGELNFDKKFYLDGSFFIPEDLSNSMIRSVSELKHLLNEEKQIFIPVKIFGKAPDVKFSIDLEYIGKKIIENRGLEEIIKVIDKSFDKDKPYQSENVQGINEEPVERQKSIEEQVIDKFIDSIFK